jgi:alkylhydroperoxidase family enzyme
MSRVELAEVSSLSPYLRGLHDDARPGDWSTRHVARAFGDNSELLGRYLDFYYPFHSGGMIDSRLKELVRLRIATLNGCKTCKAARLDPLHVSETEAAVGVDRAEEATFTERERAALRLAEAMALDHFAIGDEMIRDLQRHFSRAELLELIMMTGQYIGFGRVLAILQLEDTACSI